MAPSAISAFFAYVLRKPTVTQNSSFFLQTGRNDDGLRLPTQRDGQAESPWIAGFIHSEMVFMFVRIARRNIE